MELCHFLGVAPLKGPQTTPNLAKKINPPIFSFNVPLTVDKNCKETSLGHIFPESAPFLTYHSARLAFRDLHMRFQGHQGVVDEGTPSNIV
jgi:hypothetical protein